MYPGLQARIRPQQPAFIMAQSGETVTYAELERRSSRLAHFLRANGLGRLDHYSIFMENNARYIECCSAGERSGLYYTCINSYLMPDEVAYILENSESKILITSMAKRDAALRAMAQCPRIEWCLVVDGPGDGGRAVNLDAVAGAFPDMPIADEFLGIAMLYSSGTTGRPKGILRPLPENPPAQALPIFDFVSDVWRFREGMTYLSPAPLYHAAPLLGVALTIGSPIAARSGAYCSVSCMCSTRTCSRFPRARPALCGSRRRARSSISTTRSRPTRRDHKTAR